MNRRSLTFRLISWYCGLLLAVGGAFAAFTYASFDRYVEETTRDTLAVRADAIWGMTRGMFNDRAAVADFVERRFAPEAQNRFIRITKGGDVYYRSGPPVERGFDPAKIPLSTADDARSPLLRVGNLFLVVRSFADADGSPVIVESGRSTDEIDTAARHLALSLVVGLPVLLVIAAIGGYVLVQRALSPVEGMIEAAEAYTFNAPRERLPLAGTEDRIDALGKALNRMLERLDNSYQHASRFSTDAAHELRTPLAIMRGELELLAARSDLPRDMQNAVSNILGETVRLSQIVASLINMSHLDSVSGKRSHRPVDISALAAETIDQMRLLAVEKDIDLVMQPGAHATAAGDRDRLKQVLVNLLDNAIKYTQAGGRVEVTVAETPEIVTLTVSDTGIGIAPENLPHIFDRFFRASTDRGEIGAGLGLAIVKSICTAHGGQVSAESQVGVGSVFRVELPRATDRLAAEVIDLSQSISRKAEAA